MKTILNFITDRVATKKGMWITLIAWLLAAVLLVAFAPSAKEYEVTTIDSLPEDAQSIIAQNKIDEYFPDNDGIPALLVFQADKDELKLEDVTKFFKEIEDEKIDGLEQVVPLAALPPQAAAGFFSEDKTTAVIPMTFAEGLESRDLRDRLEQIQELAENSDAWTLYVTGPAGIAVDSLNLFSKADVVLIMSTVGLILILLVVIYRSPLLALIPLLAASFVYLVVNQTLGLMGKAGLLLSNQTISIMMILLFAAVIDYSLFVFSRFREELKHHEDKYEAMKYAMRETGMPVFFSGGTVLAAMLVLFFAEFGDYRNFAPTFGTTMAIIMIASVTLIPALFTLFGRKSFWPKIPRVGDTTVKSNSFWSKIGRFVVKKPGLSITVMGIFLLLSASNLFNLTYEFDTMKSFPDDMQSRQGYEILEEKFAKGDLAPTTVIFEGNQELSEAEKEKLIKELSNRSLVDSVRLNRMTEDSQVLSLNLTFTESPYSIETMDALEEIRNDADKIVEGQRSERQSSFCRRNSEKSR